VSHLQSDIFEQRLPQQPPQEQKQGLLVRVQQTRRGVGVQQVLGGEFEQAVGGVEGLAEVSQKVLEEPPRVDAGLFSEVRHVSNHDPDRWEKKRWEKKRWEKNRWERVIKWVIKY
jgi:hypothetical protein